MRSYLILGAAALVSASPAPQGFNSNFFDTIPVTITQGPPVGPGKAAETPYVQGKAQAAAAAAATGVATAQQAKRSVAAALEARTWWFLPASDDKEKSKSSSLPAVTPAPTYAAPVANPSSTNVAPSSCTPVDWTNTWAFTSTAACPTAIEVGTYCGFINPLDPCAAQPNAYGPPTTPDTVDAFKSNSVYANLAKSAKTPSGYAQAFSNFDGSVSGSGYLGYKTLTSYDPAVCSAYCDETETCTGFNIFIERDPKFNPEKCSCEAPSIAQIKCSIWGQDIKQETATNKGQNQAGFEVVIVGSNVSGFAMIYLYEMLTDKRDTTRRPTTPPRSLAAASPRTATRRSTTTRPTASATRPSLVLSTPPFAPPTPSHKTRSTPSSISSLHSQRCSGLATLVPFSSRPLSSRRAASASVLTAVSSPRSSLPRRPLLTFLSAVAPSGDARRLSPGTLMSMPSSTGVPSGKCRARSVSCDSVSGCSPEMRRGVLEVVGVSFLHVYIMTFLGALGIRPSLMSKM
jgi:hypothetical protein